MSKILVIEDEAAIRRVLIKILSEESDTYQVEEAEDGLKGLTAIKNTDYDLVLCDIKMPKMDGVEVLEKAKKIKPEIPMLMIWLLRPILVSLKICGLPTHRLKALNRFQKIFG